MKILDRYNTAIHASNLASDPLTTWSDTDVIGAAGLAARHEPLGIELARMLAGGGSGQVVAYLADMAYIRSQGIKGGRLSRVEAIEIAKAVLAWFTHGTCHPCGGTGYARIKDAPSLGDECRHCGGTGKIPFDSQFRHEWREVARWLQDGIERTQANAGVIAMQKIAPKLDF